jgi:O-succinylhomoserine sulfhydrylase
MTEILTDLPHADLASAEPPVTPALPDGEWQAETLLVRGGTLRSAFGETSEALYVNSGFIYPRAEDAEAAFKGENDRFIYSRYANPTVAMLEERLRLIEGAEACRTTASGMAAVFAAILAQVKAGDRVVASRALFGSIHYIVGELLPTYGIETEFVDGADLASWEAALSRPAAVVFLETPSNPTLEIIDLPAVAALAHAAGAQVIVDNVFATPVLQKPLELGADIVVYSATKHIDGQGRCLGGAILGPSAFIDGPLQMFLRHTGPALSPFNAWTLLKGLETLPLRLDRHVANARSVARFLEDHPRVRRVIFPELQSHPQQDLARRQMRAGGSIVSFEIDAPAGDAKRAAFRVLNRLRIVDISNNLGDSKSLVTHPATTTHQRLPAGERARLGITDALIRLSVGLENVDDLKNDLNQALSGY